VVCAVLIFISRIVLAFIKQMIDDVLVPAFIKYLLDVHISTSIHYT